MTARRIVLGALVLALLASLALVSVAWRGSGPAGVAPPAGTLRFGELMVVGELETPAQLDALRADCRRTGPAVDTALGSVPPGVQLSAGRMALDRYLELCRWYVLDIAVAQANAETEQAYTASYRFTGSMRASDGRVYTCEYDGHRAAGAGPARCWTADRAVWPRLAQLTGLEARLTSLRADVLASSGCPVPGLEDVCAATVARDRAYARSAAVFGEAVGRGDTRVFTWLGTPATIGVAEEDAAVAAGKALGAVCREHGFTDGTPTRHERDLMRDYATTIRIALGGGPR